MIPFRETQAGLRYALLRRRDAGYWQGVAGGGEGAESPLDAARRETAEEAGIDPGAEYVTLDACASVPVVAVTGKFTWGPRVLVIPEYAFGVRAPDDRLTLSREHIECHWFDVDGAQAAVRWDSNRTALWELDHRLRASR